MSPSSRPWGGRIITGYDIVVLKSPISGIPEFMRSCLQGQIREMAELNEGILNLYHKYILLHLLQHCISFNKIQYWTRIVPHAFANNGHYRARVLKAFLGGNCLEFSGPTCGSRSVGGGLGLNNSRYELGMQQVIHVSGLAYLVSCRHSLEHAKRLTPGYDEICVAMEDPIICPLSSFWTNEARILQNPNEKLDQTSMLQALYKTIHRDLIQSSPVVAQVRLRAAAARVSGLWLTATPSPTRDFLFSNAALIDVVSMRLGIEIFGVGETCGYCHQVMDPMDHHVRGCIR